MGEEPLGVTLGFGPSSLRSSGRWVLVVTWVVQTHPLGAQTRPDSAQVADTLALPDSAQVAEPDTISADTIFYNLPELETEVPSGFATGVWTWDREAIMASGANTIAELVSDLPGVIALRGGDYGTPAVISAFGIGGGGVRVTRDGFEVFPLAGGMADLQRVGLGGIQRVRLDRSGGEILIELTSHRYGDGRPYSLVEAGTGQLDTNVFRGTFAEPTALGGSVALALERVDTRGFGENEGGNRTGAWFRYQLHRGDRAGLAFDYRSMGSQTEVPDFAGSVSRRDIALRGRVELVEGVVVEAYTGSSKHEVDDTRAEFAFVGGSRAQHGARLALDRGGLWARGAYRSYPDDDAPSYRVDGSAGYTGHRYGLSGRIAESSWDGSSVLAYGARGWIGPVAGLSLFGSWDSGSYAGRTGPPLDRLPDLMPPFLPPEPPAGPAFAVADRTALRVGGSLTVFGVTLAAAGLRTDTDVHIPLNVQLDAGAPMVPGTERYGAEAWASLPTWWAALRLEGSYQHWDQDGPYLPKRIYRGAFVFHRVYLESENFEMWWALGVRGHDPVDVFVADDGMGGAGGLQMVPFYQNWYGRIQVRIVDVRLFLGWENLIRRRNLQNFPDRILPVTRSFFGLRWDLWN